MITVKITRPNYCRIIMADGLIAEKDKHNNKKYDSSYFDEKTIHEDIKIVWVRIFGHDSRIFGRDFFSVAIWETCGTEVYVYDNGCLIQTITYKNINEK